MRRIDRCIEAESWKRALDDKVEGEYESEGESCGTKRVVRGNGVMLYLERSM